LTPGCVLGLTTPPVGVAVGVEFCSGTWIGTLVLFCCAVAEGFVCEPDVEVAGTFVIPALLPQAERSASRHMQMNAPVAFHRFSCREISIAFLW
jgi:hypothetical protein